MKTAEEWRIEIKDNDCLSYGGSIDRTVKQIQLDAMKEGMRRAAIIAEGETFSAGKRTDWEIAYDKGCKDCESSILSAAEQLTEKDLTQ